MLVPIPKSSRSGEGTPRMFSAAHQCSMSNLRKLHLRNLASTTSWSACLTGAGLYRCWLVYQVFHLLWHCSSGFFLVVAASTRPASSNRDCNVSGYVLLHAGITSLTVLQGTTRGSCRRWDSLDVSATERKKDDLEQVSSPRQEQQISPHDSFISTFKRQMHSTKNVFTAKNSRTQTYLGVFLMGFQQSSGIDGVLYVS